MALKSDAVVKVNTVIDSALLTKRLSILWQNYGRHSHGTKTIHQTVFTYSYIHRLITLVSHDFPSFYVIYVTQRVKIVV